MRSTGLAKAIDLAGGVAELARRLGVTSQAVSQWDEVPARQVIPVAQATGGQVTPHELRPDLYPMYLDPTMAADKPRRRVRGMVG